MAESARQLTVLAAGVTDEGHGRTENEDALLLCPDVHLYLLADGTGGPREGTSAGEVAVKAIAEAFRSTTTELSERYDVRDSAGLYVAARRLVSAVHAGNRAILAMRAAHGAGDELGSTLVALLLSPGAGIVHIAHVGDSRCYRWRSHELEQLTEDHTILHDVLETRPDLDEAVLARLPRHAVTRGLGMAETVRVSVRTAPLRAGDRYLLTSDGLTDALPEARIAEILGRRASPRKTARALVDAANIACTPDNVAVMVISCRPERKRAPQPRHSVPRPQRRSMRTPDSSTPEIIIESVMHGSLPPKDPER